MNQSPKTKEVLEYQISVICNLVATLMAGVALTCLRSMMKLANCIMGMVGVSVILYGFWMLRIWQIDVAEQGTIADPWFIYTVFSIGVTLCFITCIGHVSADSSNGFCLSCYGVLVFLILLLETGFAADILLNSDWEKDLPEDPTGKFHDLKEFVETNLDVFKWMILLVVLAQGLSILLAMALRVLGRNGGLNYESDDEYHAAAAARLPLVNADLHSIHTIPYVVGDPMHDPWKTNK